MYLTTLYNSNRFTILNRKNTRVSRIMSKYVVCTVRVDYIVNCVVIGDNIEIICFAVGLQGGYQASCYLLSFCQLPLS